MNIIGSFYLILTGNGNLLGEFFNNMNHIVSTESATRMDESINFEGSYFSSWIEDNDSANSLLTITRVENTNLFELVWTNNGNNIFIGKAQIIRDMLVGYYQN